MGQGRTAIGVGALSRWARRGAGHVAARPARHFQGQLHVAGIVAVVADL